MCNVSATAGKDMYLFCASTYGTRTSFQKKRKEMEVLEHIKMLHDSWEFK